MNPLWELVESACVKYPDLPSLHTLTRSYSFTEVKTIAKNIAAELRDRGLRPGDLVATKISNSADWLFVLACAHEGLLSVSVYSPEQAFELGAALFVHRDGADSAGIESLAVDEHWLRHMESGSNHTPPRDYAGPESLARLVLTSGTTGKAKAAEYSVGTFQTRLDNAERVWNLGSGNRINFVGVSTMGGLSQGVLSLWAGAPFFAFDAITDKVPVLITEFDVTLLLGSTVNLTQLADAVATAFGSIDSVTQILIGGSTPNNALLHRLAEVFPAALVMVLYGSTEGGVISARRAVVDADARNVGTPFPGVQVDVLDAYGTTLPRNEVGEIRYRSPELIQRYYRDPAATVDALRDGYFYPGDRGYISTDGELVITGRLDDVLNIGGVKVDPLEIERIAFSVMGVIDAGLIEQHAADGRSQLALALVAESDLAMREVDARIRDQAPAAVPAVYVRVNDLPRNAMGKLDRRALAQQLNEKHA
jgi:acyl-coenzyme A synthetase/AMP-(fatty) acid ligase